MKKNDYKQTVKWMNPALRFLRLSMDPKKLQMNEKFEAELEELQQKGEEDRKTRQTVQKPVS